MMLRTCLGVLAVGICVLAGCSQSEMSVASQKQSNWLDVDRSALSLAGDPPHPRSCRKRISPPPDSWKDRGNLKRPLPSTAGPRC